jgi:hypothetical protein
MPDLRVAKFTAFVAFAALSQPLSPSIAAAQTARVEVHPIKTMTLTDQQFLNGAKDGPEVIVGGELRLPICAPLRREPLRGPQGHARLGPGQSQPRHPA